MFSSGCFYDGYFSLETGMLEGTGTMTTANEVINGNWKESKLTGKATRRTKTGDEYIGDWLDGKLHGKGYYRTKTESYEGDFYDNFEHGMGKKEFSNGSYY